MNSAGAKLGETFDRSTVIVSSPPAASISSEFDGEAIVIALNVEFKLSILIFPDDGLLSLIESAKSVAMNFKSAMAAVLVTLSSVAVSVTVPSDPARVTESLPAPPSTVSGHANPSPDPIVIASAPPTPLILNDPLGLSNVIAENVVGLDVELTANFPADAVASCIVSALLVPSITRFCGSSIPEHTSELQSRLHL